MNITSRAWRLKQMTATSLLAYAVALHGLILIAATLEDQLVIRGLRVHPSGLVFDVPLLIGLTLMYLSIYLRRRKQTAWFLALSVYGALLVLGLTRLALGHGGPHVFELELVVRSLVLPCAVVLCLVRYRDEYTVKSDVRSFASSLKFIVVVLAVAFLYGLSGFLLLDNHDFHQDISWREAAHRTVDQFGLTTSHDLVPHTRRAKVFMDSLSVISTGAVAYALISLFQPLRVRLIDQSDNRKLARELLERYPGNSEDFFKLWPHDKMYFFNQRQTAGLAYGVHRGVALVVGGPFGAARDFDTLLRNFDELCRTNDWIVAFIHTEPQRSELYKRHGFSLQKIGEEAVVDLQAFHEHVETTKYFRQVGNKLTRQEYSAEYLTPPHSQALIDRLRVISKDWQAQPGRAERRFMMGYFGGRYLQQCPVMVLRDRANTIQAFVNVVPTFDTTEANFDMLRHTKQAPGNSNDFLLMALVAHLRQQGVQRLNLGLCPLAGLDDQDEERSVVDNALRFVYANGDRFYSFSGLHRFKAKYKPEWRSRYIAYRGGIRTFSRVINALNRAMKVR
jgi:phosphatidylglycerol lysyltransferase